MRAATASAREPRGERTLMGIGPEFIRREIVSNGVSGTLDGVPQERMDRTPSSPIVVEPQAVAPAPTVRIPLPAPSRTVQLSVSPAPTVVLPVEQPTSGPSLRLNSLISGKFFQEGEQQEAKNWEDSPLVNEPFPDEAPAKFSSFDHVPRYHGPLLVTTFLLGTALVIGLAVKGAGTGAARAWLATEAGPRAVQVWNRARTGLALRLTPESTAASARAMTAPANTGAQAVPVAAATAPQVTAPAATPPKEEKIDNASTEDLWAPLVAAGPAPPIMPHLTRRLAANAAVNPIASDATARRAAESRRPVAEASKGVRPQRRAEPTEVDADEVNLAALRTEPKTDDRAEPPRKGLVWSPTEQRLVQAQPASVDSAVTAPRPETANPGAKAADKDVLPLDDDAHTTY